MVRLKLNAIGGCSVNCLNERFILNLFWTEAKEGNLGIDGLQVSEGIEIHQSLKEVTGMIKPAVGEGGVGLF